IIFLLVFNE
ncbi:O-acetyltransferase OatA, partial [Haemophilus influenzae]